MIASELVRSVMPARIEPHQRICTRPGRFQVVHRPSCLSHIRASGICGPAHVSLSFMAKTRISAQVDIWSRGEVAAYLVELARTAQVKPCRHLALKRGHASAFYPKCKIDWASQVAARNVPIDTTAYSGPSSYSWPKCPEDCPHFIQAEDFLVSVSRDQYSQEDSGAPRPQVAEPIATRIDYPPGNSSKPTPAVPHRVTLRWLFQHVPVNLWLSAAALLCTAFFAGVHSTRFHFVREVLGLTTAPLVANPEESVSEKAKPIESPKETGAGGPTPVPYSAHRAQ